MKSNTVITILATALLAGCASSDRVPLGAKEALFHRKLQFTPGEQKPAWTSERRDAVLIGANKSEGAHRYSTHFSEGKGDVTVGWFDGNAGSRLAPAAHPNRKLIGYYVPRYSIYSEQIWIADTAAEHHRELSEIADHEVDHVFGRKHSSAGVWKPWQNNYKPYSTTRIYK